MRSTPLLALIALLTPILATGCASEPKFTLPMTAIDFARNDSGPALVAYLGQRDASADVCDARSRSPHLARFDDDMRASLVDGLVDGKIDSKLWRKCVKAFLRSAPPDMSASLMDDIAHGYKRVLLDPQLDQSPVLQERLMSMQKLYLDRDNGLNGHAKVLGPMFDDLRNAIVKKRLGPMATRFANELIIVVDLERGVFEGHPVDVALVDKLYAAKNERGLKVFSERLPSEALRQESRRRIIRLHIAASPYPEVRAAAAAVEETLMKRGNNPVSVAEHAASRAWLAPKAIEKRGVLVRQNLFAQTVKLLGVRTDVSGASVVPDISLKGALLVEVAGISQPITVCAAAKALDPSPCLEPGEVKTSQVAAYVDAKGTLRFADQFSTKDALALAAGGATITVPLQVGAGTVATLSWPLAFERPADAVFVGASAGANGPPLGVHVDRRDPKRIVFDVRTPDRDYFAIVEALDAGYFHVASRGAQGASGSPGSDGSDGSSGGTCEDGGPGGDGGPGSDGGPGGDGGTIDVHVSCGGAPCADAVAFFGRMITSQAGAGGDGGPGGRGGSGGSGGPAGPDDVTTNADGTTTTTPGCSAGSSGSSGSDGASGADGPPGKAGRVTVAADP